MEKLLLYIKHHFGFFWGIIDRVNGMLFSWLFKSKFEGILTKVLQSDHGNSYVYRRLELKDIKFLSDMILAQTPENVKYFNPHGFSIASLTAQNRKQAFLMMGVFDGDKIVGYFFLRFFANKKCFVGRLIDINYRGKGIGEVMNNIMYQIAWQMNFRCLSTISRNNLAVMKAHAKNPTMIILKELANDYLLVEFVRKNGES
jgi:hypothetical protein